MDKKKVSEAQRKAADQYDKENMCRISVNMPKTLHDEMMAIIDRKKEMHTEGKPPNRNAYILKAVREANERRKEGNNG